MPRLIRKKPLFERIKDYLNPGDFLLWLSEENETRDWDSKTLASPIAFAFHFVFLIARANTGGSTSRGADDVFGDDYSGTGWLSYIATVIVFLLTSFSIVNAVYAFSRRRHYRLFETSIDAPQSTPSAKRVRVDSSPVSSSPLRLLTSILGDPSAESRAHPDPTRDVWELAVWDPLPICLQLFCHFSPGHVLVYLLFLPILPSDPRPSVTVATTIFLEMLLSSQLYILQSNFSQQEKDTSIIHKEVMGEYDKKFVHPRLNPLMRDVATQYTSSSTEPGTEGEGSVVTYIPTVILKREFHTHPNPNYAKHIDLDNAGSNNPRRTSSPVPAYTPTAAADSSREPTPFTSVTPRPPIRQPLFRPSVSTAVSTGASTGAGGSLGVYTHANSPLKKATSMYDIQGSARHEIPKNSFDMAGREIREERERSMSPAKRRSEAHRSLPSNSKMPISEDGDRRTSAPGGFGKQRPSAYDSPYKRGPSRF